MWRSPPHTEGTILCAEWPKTLGDIITYRSIVETTWTLQRKLGLHFEAVMFRFKQLAIAALAYSRAYAFVNYGNVHPTAYYANDPSNITQKLSYDNSTSITLSTSFLVITLDYGTEVAGFPFLVTSNANASVKVQIEVKYAEDLVSLGLGSADGPWTFSNGLSNSFRVQTLQIDSPGYFEDFFIQGGQR
ncbi:hypothetical protein DM02DRAFT_617640 [Periconia macrospinosa]|uniref:Uncharacterized protein n=1 Tax=Periconia macrospinosa TaxID=97972 RepID=A0A2V1DCF3_9PLEO|nr:hypothetical protein DM02DRAFT_617640 [Periconia macrospinosa]